MAHEITEVVTDEEALTSLLNEDVNLVRPITQTPDFDQYITPRCFQSVLCCFVLFLQENIPIDEVFGNLRCTLAGLSTKSAEERLAIFGHNKLEETKVLDDQFIHMHAHQMQIFFHYINLYAWRQWHVLFIYFIIRKAKSSSF